MSQREWCQVPLDRRRALHACLPMGIWPTSPSSRQSDVPRRGGGGGGVQSLSRVQLFVTPWTAARQASLSFTISQSLLKFMSIESMMPSNISSSVVPFSSCLQSFPASGSFLRSWLFASGGQSIGASASVLPMNIQG